MKLLYTFVYETTVFKSINLIVDVFLSLLLLKTYKCLTVYILPIEFSTIVNVKSNRYILVEKY